MKTLQLMHDNGVAIISRVLSGEKLKTVFYGITFGERKRIENESTKKLHRL